MRSPSSRSVDFAVGVIFNDAAGSGFSRGRTHGSCRAASFLVLGFDASQPAAGRRRDRITFCRTPPSRRRTRRGGRTARVEGQCLSSSGRGRISSACNLRLVRWLPFSVLSLPPSRHLSADPLAWAVRTSSRLVPAATCLTQSLALQCVLTTAGRPCRVEIGVAKDARGKFQSHACVEHDGHTLLTTPTEVTRYARLLTLPAPASQ
jgi:hypothetical protein